MESNGNDQRPHFFVSSALKDLIGRELVSNKYIAVFELVKNSYDANAETANIVFHHSVPEDGTVNQILIYDDGKGMTEKDVRDKWLFIGYSDKKTPEANLPRMPSGRKGIGRFSCDRLGSYLDMFTRTKDDSRWTHVKIDWGAFEQDQSKRLEEIKVDITAEDTPKIVKEYYSGLEIGTFLIITKPRDKWPYEDLFSLRKYLQRMVNPYEPIADFRLFLGAPAYEREDSKRIRENEEHEAGPDEQYEQWTPKGPVSGEITNAVIEKVKERSSWIRGIVEGGKVTISLSEGRDLLIETREKSPFGSIGLPEGAFRVEAEIFYLNRSAKNIFTRIMGVRPIDFGSIHVYLNAFRVLPYGESANDWLQLDLRRTQGWRRFLSTRDIMGRVSISDRSNTFKEVASREGFYEGQPLTELRHFLIEYLIKRLERYVVETVGWKSDEEPVTEDERKIELVKLVDYIAGSTNDFLSVNVGPNMLEIIKGKEVRKIPELVESLESLAKQVPSEEQKEFLEVQLNALKHGVRELNKNLREREKEIMFLEKSESLRGSIAGLVDHEVVLAADDVIPSIEKVIRELSRDDKMKTLVDSLQSAILSVQKMAKLAELALSAKFNLKNDIVEGNIVQFIVQYMTNTKRDLLEREGVTIKFIGDDKKAVKKLDYLNLSILVDNMVSNSLKAECKNIIVKFEQTGDKLRILLSDDGAGVSKDAVDNLFVPGFSTRGTSGLGLYHVKKIAGEMGWKIGFIGNEVKGLGKGACFELII